MCEICSATLRLKCLQCVPCRNCKFYSLIRPFDKDDLRMLAKVADFFSNQTQQRMAPFELTAGQWQAFGNWFMSYLRLFRCHQQLWMARSPTAICGFGVDRARAEALLAHQPSVSASHRLSPSVPSWASSVPGTCREPACAKALLHFPTQSCSQCCALSVVSRQAWCWRQSGGCRRLSVLRLGLC